MDSAESMDLVVVALLPPNVDLIKAINAIVIPFAMKLETSGFSCYFARYDRIVTFIGGLNLILGDHVSQCDLSGLPSALSKGYICRYSMTPKDSICKAHTLDELKSLERSSVATYQVISSLDDERCLVHIL
jgi:hypothetical protein